RAQQSTPQIFSSGANLNRVDGFDGRQNGGRLREGRWWSRNHSSNLTGRGEGCQEILPKLVDCAGNHRTLGRLFGNRAGWLGGGENARFVGRFGAVHGAIRGDQKLVQRLTIHAEQRGSDTDSHPGLTLAANVDAEARNNSFDSLAQLFNLVRRHV